MRNLYKILVALVVCAVAPISVSGAPKNSAKPILYAASQGGLAPDDSAIYRVTPKGISVLAEDVGGPQKMDVNPAGNLFIAEPSWDAGDRVWAIPRGGSLTTFFEFKDSNGSPAGRASPYGLTVAPDGTLFVGASPDYTVYSQTIYSIDDQATSTPLAAIDGGIMGLSLDSAGNLYAAVSYFSLHRIYMVTRTGAISVAVDGLPAMPHDVQVGPDGALYIAVNQTNRIYRWDPSIAAPTLAVFADIESPRSLTIDGAGYLYVGQGGGRISTVDPQGNVSLIASGFRGTAITGIAVDCPPAKGNGKLRPCFRVKAPLAGP